MSDVECCYERFQSIWLIMKYINQLDPRFKIIVSNNLSYRYEKDPSECIENESWNQNIKVNGHIWWIIFVS